MPQLGDVFIDTVYEENPEKQVKSTDHPVEEGVNVTDHIEKKPFKFEIEGVIIGNDAEVRKRRLEQYMNSGERLKYVYRNAFSGLIIEKFEATYDVEVVNGFKYSMSLKQIIVSKPSILVKLPKELQPQVAKKSNKGRQQPSGQNKPKKIYTVKSGDYLSKIGAKFNVSWLTIYEKNKKVIGGNPDLIFPGQKIVIP